MTVLVPRRRILKPQISIPRLNFRRLGDPSFNRLGVRGQPWGHGLFSSAEAAQTYAEKVRGHAAVRHWRLCEITGTVAEEEIDGDHGTYGRDVSVMGTGAGIGDCATAPIWSGADYVDIYSAALNALFDGDEFAVMAWAAADSGVWTDGNTRYVIGMAASTTTDYFNIRKHSTNNLIRNSREGSNQMDVIDSAGHSETNFLCYFLNCSRSGNKMELFIDTVSQGTATGLGNWVGNLNSLRNAIGSYKGDSAGSPWKGRISNVVLFGSAQSQEVIDDLFVVP